MWHARFLRSLLDCLVFGRNKPDQLTPDALFLPSITSTHAPLSECDYNLHKSNSTYWTDLDMSRGRLGLLLFQKGLSVFPGKDATLSILSSNSIVFRQEIKPFQSYEIWTRVLSWDHKWLYLVSHIVVKGRFKPESCFLQPQVKGRKGKSSQRPASKEQRLKGIYASAISRYVFKKGRVTVPPSKMLDHCGLLPLALPSHDANERTSRNDMMTSDSLNIRSNEHLYFDENKVQLLQAIEKRRIDALPIAQLLAGWDAVHDQFMGDTEPALGRYADLLWG
ncbi:hypothetical protein ACHAPC_010865 [Botrytis cinerea]